MADDADHRSDAPGSGDGGAGSDPDGACEADPDPGSAGDADRGVDGAVATNSTSERATAGSDRTAGSEPDPGGRPDVVVPMDLYKTVTVFSTLFAVALVVGGMIALDAATARATADAAEVHLPLAFLGVASIVLGAATYAFASRFRAEGMGNPKDADDER